MRQGGARFRWRGGSAVEDSALGSLARVYDVAVLSRPGSRGARMTALEAVLFDSGRPVLMAPPAPPKSPLGQTVLIHWNASTETARVIALAMPILRKAKRVSFIAVEGHISPGPSVKDAVAHLEANGIAATEKTVTGRQQAGRSHPGGGGRHRRRPADQGRLHAEPAAPDDLRRRHQPHPGLRGDPRAAGALGRFAIRKAARVWHGSSLRPGRR